ncbi:DUF2785 domain-containing protein [Nocardioides seonyuensis]|uniref:DUF2785 domain-containing protein n=1 Tax=Nocardioides seonyuensis TaxID=2518371 RepID=A0A4P7IJK4_9ACTN|nr:DUF2785 domain-containing protein [Nocardioides seonyuensis]QBX56477.1 DUF2785 domain-containing protein [Nocardioides seonyuensis]
MVSDYWQQVQRTGLQVPADRPLDELTAELTSMLGSTAAEVRDGTAYPVLATWIDRGVYDDLLAGLGDGMVAGLQSGLGESGTDSVFRRSFSALVLSECLQHNNERHLLPGSKVLEWGDHIATWYLRERDTRGYVQGKGWAHAIAHGADAIGVLAGSPHFAANELTVLLDVVADRLLMPSSAPLLSGEPDRMAVATMAVLRRNVVSLSILEPWIARIAASARALGSATENPYARTLDPQNFLRALFVQLSLAADPPQVRPDLLLTVIDALRATNSEYLQAPRQPAEVD